MDQFPRFGKRELIYLLLFTRNYVVSVGDVCSSSGCLGWATFLLWHSLCLPYNYFGLSSIYSLDAFLIGKA